MAVEDPLNTIKGLVATNPHIQDPVHDGPKHLWMIKRVLKAIFPGKSGDGLEAPLLASEDDFNSLVGVHDRLNDVGITDPKLQLGIPAPKNIAAALTYLREIVRDLNDRMGTTEGTLHKLYPVGSIYFNLDDSRNPNELMGFGTWERIASGTFLTSSSALFDSKDTSTHDQSGKPLPYQPGEKGGTADAIVVAHSHTLNASGVHNHSYVKAVSGSATNGSNPFPVYASSQNATTGDAGGHTHQVNTTGQNGRNMNLPPYLAVNMWKRTA